MKNTSRKIYSDFTDYTRYIAVLSLIMLTLLDVGGHCQDLFNRPLNGFNPRNLYVSFSPAMARPAGMGGAGLAMADDPSAVSVNPAGIAVFTEPALTIGTRISRVRRNEPAYGLDGGIREVTSSSFSFNHNSITTIVPIKSIRVSTFYEILYDVRFDYRINNALNSGPQVPANGVEGIYQGNFPSLDKELHMQIIDNGGSLGWRLGDKLNFGFSLRVMRLEYNLVERSYFAAQLSPGSGRQNSQISGENLYAIHSLQERDWGVGYSFGFVSSPVKRLSLGLVFHHRPTFNLDSKLVLPTFQATLDGTTLLEGQQQDSTSRTRFDLPDMIGVGLAYKYRSTVNFALDITYTRYGETIEKLSSDDAENPLNLIQDDDLFSGEDPDGLDDLQIDDRWAVHTGMEYILKLPRFRQRMPLRLGYYLEPSHDFRVRDGGQAFNGLFPRGNNRHHFTGGFGLFLKERLRMDFSANIAREYLQFLGSTSYVF